MPMSSDAAFNYHQRTKHHFNAYAKGPESLDWDDQPQPFRRFAGCETVKLPMPGRELELLYGDLDQPGNIAPQALTLANLSLLLELSFGLSAWKQFGPDRWALRCNPSSGNLHPTEAYIVCSDAELLSPGVYHYVSYDHHLERRCRFAEDGLATTDNHPLPPGEGRVEGIKPNLTGEVYIGLSSVHWREAWKYGERAFRYCQHDIGHALAALSVAAACLGWRIELLGEAADADIAHWLGLDRGDDFIADERETADIFCRLHVGPSPAAAFDAAGVSARAANAQWFGTAQRLGGRHFYRWPIIDEVAEQLHKPATTAERWQAEWLPLPVPSHNLAATRLIRQRRSAQHFNAKAQALPQADFQRMLLALLPNAKPPFNAWNWPPQVHLLIFVHRVEGVEPGLYCLLREAQALNDLKTAMSAEFLWQAVAGPLPLYLLTPGNVRQAAKTLSCHQPIASDSAFSLGMLAKFADNVAAEAWRYRRLFWECGLLGQILYLEAEAAGVRGTGIGCFFDDAVHGVLGLKDNAWQSLYHFTVGEPLDDGRLQSFPAYGHLAK